MEYKVNTKIIDNDKIEQITELVSDVPKIHEVIQHEIMNLKEIGVTDALIKLGWTPPSEHNQKVIEKLNNLLWHETILSNEKNYIAQAIKLLGGEVDDYNE